MCARSSVKTTPRGSSTTDIGDLQSVIDLFVTNLKPYHVELEEEAESIEEITDFANIKHEADESVVLLKVQRLSSGGSHADQLENVDPHPCRSVSATSSSSASSSSTSEVS